MKVKHISIAFFIILIVSENVLLAQDFWTITNASLKSQATSIASNSSTEIFVSTSSNGVYCSVDKGLTWNPVNNAWNSRYIAAIAISPKTQTIIAGADSIYRSTDNGKTWKLLNNIWTMKLTCSKNGDFFIGTPVNGAIRSTDDGLTWTGISSGLTQYSIYSFAFGDSAKVFTSSYDSAVYSSTNNGDSWKPIPIPNYNDVYSLATYNGELFAGTTWGVYITDYNKINWEIKNNDLTNASVSVLLFNSYGHLYAGTYGGIYRSTDMGESWLNISSGLTDTNITCMTFSPDGFIYAGTQSGSVFKSINPMTAVIQIKSNIPVAFELKQNFPNPFNPATTINYSIPQSGFVTIKLYDILGRQVATLVNDNKPAGNYSAKFDGSKLVSGVYFYRMEAGSFSQTKKLLLLK